MVSRDVRAVSPVVRVVDLAARAVGADPVVEAVHRTHNNGSNNRNIVVRTTPTTGDTLEQHRADAVGEGHVQEGEGRLVAVVWTPSPNLPHGSFPLVAS